ncbi:unnamed protein product [Effrenium voratum]|uniref:Pentatricopeptide repeat-containing protein, chloroplastic n=1 Tax=Effrenium voratum TaxID=2562239 RepID=A0AA36J0Z0_9DINO|nr:unnamed protein product [Effrenium voratum]
MSDIKSCGRAMSAFAREGQWRSVLQVLDNLRPLQLELNVIVFNIALASLSRWQQALGLLCAVCQLQPDLISCNSALKPGAWQQGVGLVSRMALLRLAPDAISLSAVARWPSALSLAKADVVLCGSVAAAYQRASQWLASLDLLEHMGHARVQANTVVLNSVISAAAWQFALSLLERMAELQMADVVSFNSAMAVSDWAAALGLLAKMPSCSVSPDLISYSSAISAAEKGGQWEVALSLLTSVEDMSPDVICYSSAISACEKGSQWRMALLLLTRMGSRKVTPNLISYNSAISACEKAGQDEAALAVLAELQAQTRPDVVSFSAALSALSWRRWRTAGQLLEAMRHQQIQLNVVALNSALAVAFSWQRALHLALGPRLKVDLLGWGLLVGFCERFQQWAAAQRLLCIDAKLTPTRLTWTLGVKLQ